MSLRPLLLPAVLLSSSLGLDPLAASQCESFFEGKVFPADPTGVEDFGNALAADEDWLAVGAHQSDGDGAVFLDRLGVVLEETKLLPPVPGQQGDFGFCLDLDLPWLVVGEPFHDGGRGRAHVYELVSGVWTARQVFEGVGANDRIGADVSVDASSGLMAFGSAINVVDVYGLEAGSWSKLRRLQPILTGSYGAAVHLDGHFLAVGAPATSSGRGAVYVYEGHGLAWDLLDQLVPADLGSSTFFGLDLKLDQGRLLVGAQGADLDGSASGAAFLYEYDGAHWQEGGVLRAPARSGAESQGRSVDLRGDVALLGAPYRPSLEDAATGTVLMFRQQGSDWVLQEERSAPPFGHIGLAVAQNDTTIFTGDHAADLGVGAVWTAPRTSLALQIDPPDPSLGQPVAVHTAGGAPGNLVALSTAAVDGLPFFRILLQSVFDAEGGWTLLGVHDDPALVGVVVELQSFGMDAAGKVRASPLRSLSFQ